MMKTNLLDLNNDILNIISDYVKKDNFEKEIIKEEQIINGKKITFPCLRHPYYICEENWDYLKHKRFIFKYIDTEMIEVREYAKTDKIKLTNQNHRICIWIFFQRYKLILNDYKINLNMEDENKYLDEYLTVNKLNLKKKNYSFNY